MRRVVEGMWVLGVAARAARGHEKGERVEDGNQEFAKARFLFSEADRNCCKKRNFRGFEPIWFQKELFRPCLDKDTVMHCRFLESTLLQMLVRLVSRTVQFQ